MRLLLLVLLALVCAGSAAASHDPGDLCPVSVCTSKSTLMHQLHNWTRGQHGVGPLYREPWLYRTARQKADRIVMCDDFSHTPCGDPFECPAEYPACGENLVCGYLTIRSAFNAWMHSSGHRANVLGSWRFYGSAFVATGLPSCPRLWVTVFAR